jgi:hypothetical protein
MSATLDEAFLETAAEPVHTGRGTKRWLILQYTPVALFSLKMSRASSTAGKTLVIPTPYAVKMAFVDVSLRHGLTGDPETLIRGLAQTQFRIGVPQDACVTATILSVRQETREEDRKRRPDLPPYRSSIAVRELVHFRGILQLALDISSCAPDVMALLIAAAPAINYFGKRGSFVQYSGSRFRESLDSTFTQRFAPGAPAPPSSHRSLLDDFGPGASFAALNSFSPARMTIEPVAEAPAQPKRRRYSIAEKRRIVEESFEPKTSGARVARAHGVNANQVFSGRRLYQRGRLGGT